MKILSLNVLGPNFSDPRYYPPQTHRYLDGELRWSRLRSFLLQQRGEYDVIVLQEVTDATFERITALLTQFWGFFVPHGYDHWADDSVSGWVPNGNAIFVRNMRNIQYYDVDLTHGNHAALIIGRYGGKTLCLVNVHLDSDDVVAREREFTTLLAVCETFTADMHLCVGDFNTGLNQAPYYQWFTPLGYRADTNTIPTFTIIERPMDRIPIDHVLYRGTTLREFTVLNSAIWYPGSTNVTRFLQNVRYCGSDHLPVVVTI